MPRTRLVAVLVVLAGLVGGVTACSDPTVQPGPVASTVTLTPTAAPPTTVTVGATTLTVQPLDPAGSATVTPAEDGSMRLGVASGETVLTAPAQATFRVLDDGSAVVEDSAGAFLAGVSPDGPGIRLVQQDPTSVRLTGPAPTGVWIADVAVQDAVWGQAEGGKSLAVSPSTWARAGGLAAQTGLWSQLIARQPDADTPTMQAPLECHELGAPDKATWNLEPWRPEVSALDMIAARCNPT